MPRRGPEAGILRRENDFHDSGVNRIDLCAFQQSRIIVAINKILGSHQGNLKHVQTTSAERQHMVTGYLWIKKKRIKVNLSHDLSSSDISGNIFNVTSSTPFFNEVCIEPESTGGKSACV